MVVIVCTIIMLVGAVARFTYLDSKIFSNDEATTALHVSGKTIQEYAAATFDGKPRTAHELAAFQEPDQARGPAEVIRSLAVEDPQHPPLYYLFERQWELSAGSSISARRTLAAIFGSFAIICAFWFASEVASRLAGFITGALVAASPFAIAYSQVDREYSLWMGLTFAASALFVIAFARNNVAARVAYVFVCIAGMYTDTLFVLVMLGHCIAIALMKVYRGKALRTYLFCVAIIALAYVPWIPALQNGLLHGVVTNNLYLAGGIPLNLFALKWLFNIGTLFYDADYLAPKTAVLILPGIFTLIACFVICARQVRSRPVIEMLFAIAAVQIVALVVPDLINHEQRSTASRYLVPFWTVCYTALGVGLAYFVGSKSILIRRASLWFIVLTAITGLGSFAVSTRHHTWWVDGSTASIGPIAQDIAKVRKPVVVYHSTWGPGRPGPGIWNFSVVMLADIVNPATLFVQYGRDEPSAMPAISGTLLLLDPDDTAIATLRARGASASELAAPGSGAQGSQDVAVLRKTSSEQRGADNGWSFKSSIWAVRLP